jgi:protein-L-isoaspartate(D-aspartate) O-methyltransferase
MLRGDAAHAHSAVLALDEPGTTLRGGAAHAPTLDLHALARALHAAPRDATPLRRITADDVWGGFGLWLALHDPAFCHVRAHHPSAPDARIPNLAGTDGALYGLASTLGVAGDGELAVFAPRGARDVVVRRFGPDRGAVTRVQRAIADWDDAGRPGNTALRVTVDPAGAASVALGGWTGSA